MNVLSSQSACGNCWFDQDDPSLIRCCCEPACEDSGDCCDDYDRYCAEGYASTTVDGADASSVVGGEDGDDVGLDGEGAYDAAPASAPTRGPTPNEGNPTTLPADGDESGEEEEEEEDEGQTPRLPPREEQPMLVDVSGGNGGTLPTAAFWRAVANALGIDLSGNPLRGGAARGALPRPSMARENDDDGDEQREEEANETPEFDIDEATAGKNAFCLQKSKPMYYAGEWTCDCDCAGCNCRRYYACWDCESGRCLSQAAYECAKGDFSFFNEKLQVCAWEQPRPLPYGCPPRPPGPPKPPRPPKPPPRPLKPPPIPGFPAAPSRPPSAMLPVPATLPQPQLQPALGQPGFQQPGVGVQPGVGFQPGVGVQPGVGFQPGVGVQPGVGFQPGFQPGRPGGAAPVGQPAGGGSQVSAQGSCASVPQCNSCLQSSDQKTFVCCCDTECLTWNPNAPNQPAGFLGCCSDYQQVCGRTTG